MKETFKNNLKVTIISVAVIIIAIAGYLANIFLGNPIAKAGAEKQIKMYLNDSYEFNEYVVSSPVYDFKTASYHTFVNSPTSEDTQFEVSYGNNKIVDTYSTDVGEKNNTWTRLHIGFNNAVTAVFEEKFKADIFFAGLGKHHTKEDIKSLILDMPLEMENLPLDSFAVIYIQSEDRTWGNLARVITEIDEYLFSKKITIDTYDIALEKSSAQSVGVYDFPRELLVKENLPQIMKEHYEAWIKKQS